jgi:hypothetical protein
MDDDPLGVYNAGVDMPRYYADASKEAVRVGSQRPDPSSEGCKAALDIIRDRVV